MSGQPGAKIVVSAQDLENTGREELLPQLAEFEVAVGCEG